MRPIWVPEQDTFLPHFGIFFQTTNPRKKRMDNQIDDPIATSNGKRHSTLNLKSYIK